jgi:hypothetical protein
MLTAEAAPRGFAKAPENAIVVGSAGELHDLHGGM